LSGNNENSTQACNTKTIGSAMMDGRDNDSNCAPAAVLDASDQRAVDELNRLVEQQRHSTSACRAGSRELRIMLYFCGSLMLLMCATYVLLPQSSARLVTAYVSIVAAVVSGWGIYRAFHAPQLQPAGLRKMYAVVFGIMTSFYCMMLLSLTRMFNFMK
jgi:hypothetical protein